MMIDWHILCCLFNDFIIPTELFFMGIHFNTAFGIHEQSLHLKAKRAEILANNIANADTPHFKAKDIDFKGMLNQAQSKHHTEFQTSRLQKTHSVHINSRPSSEEVSLLYRIPLQPDTGDGNTVETQIEQTQFAENAMQYQTSLGFLNARIKGLLSAIRGE
jgi:flagellar basal-body rod protein FlgB